MAANNHYQILLLPWPDYNEALKELMKPLSLILFCLCIFDFDSESMYRYPPVRTKPSPLFVQLTHRTPSSNKGSEVAASHEYNTHA